MKYNLESNVVKFLFPKTSTNSPDEWTCCLNSLPRKGDTVRVILNGVNRVIQVEEIYWDFKNCSYPTIVISGH